MPHPATQIFIWMMLSLQVQTLSPVYLFSLVPIVMLIAFKMHTRRFFNLLRRSRWILISLLAIYLFATPGQSMWEMPYLPSPTFEGLQEGLMQLGRLISVIAGLSILLTLLSREQLIAGIYGLLYPLHYLGISRERIAIRLALTLHYAEDAMRDTANDWQSAITTALQDNKMQSAHIELHLQPTIRLDRLLWMLGGLLLLQKLL